MNTIDIREAALAATSSFNRAGAAGAFALAWARADRVQSDVLWGRRAPSEWMGDLRVAKAAAWAGFQRLTAEASGGNVGAIDDLAAALEGIREINAAIGAVWAYAVQTGAIDETDGPTIDRVVDDDDTVPMGGH